MNFVDLPHGQVVCNAIGLYASAYTLVSYRHDEACLSHCNGAPAVMILTQDPNLGVRLVVLPAFESDDI